MPDRVGGPHLEGVAAVGETGVAVWARAGAPGAVVEAALEARAGLARGEGEARGGVVGRVGGRRVDGRLWGGEVDLHRARRERVDGLVADPVEDAVAVPRARRVRRRVRVGNRAPAAHERVADAADECRRPALDHARGHVQAGERVRARVDRDRHRAVGVVAVGIGDGAARGCRRVRRDREGVAGRVAGGVVRRDRLRAGEVVQVVGRRVRARRVLDAAGEGDLVDAGAGVGARRRGVEGAGLGAVDEDLGTAHVRVRARLVQRDRRCARIRLVDPDRGERGPDGLDVADVVHREVADGVDAVGREVDGRALVGARRRDAAVGRVVGGGDPGARVGRGQRDRDRSRLPGRADRGGVVGRGRGRDVLGDLEAGGGGVAGAVVRGHGLDAEEIVQVVAGRVRGARVLDAAREDDPVDAGDGVGGGGLHVVGARLVRVHEDLGADDVRERARLVQGEDGCGRIREVDLDDVRRGVGGLVADSVGDAVAVLGALTGGDRIGACDGVPGAGERVAGAAGERGRAPLEHGGGRRNAGEGVCAGVHADDHVAVGVVAVRVGEGAAGGLGRVRRDRELARGGEAGAVEGGDGLGAGEVAEGVAGGVRAGEVVGRAGEAHLVDAGKGVRARGLDVVRPGLVRVDEDLRPGDVRVGARLGERHDRRGGRRVVDRDRPWRRGVGVSGRVGGERAQVVVAVGERGGVPVDRVGGVCVGVDRRPGAVARRPALELGGVDAGAAVGRVGGDGEGAGDEGAVGRSRQRAGRVRVVDDDILDGGVERVAGAVGHADEHADVAVGGLARPGDAVVRARRARADRGRGRAGGARAVEVRERVDARGGVGAGAGQLPAVPDRARRACPGSPRSAPCCRP